MPRAYQRFDYLLIIGDTQKLVGNIISILLLMAFIILAATNREIIILDSILMDCQDIN